MDFGIARSLVAEKVVTKPGVVVGTLGYMSPEQMCGKPVDARRTRGRMVEPGARRDRHGERGRT